MDNYKIARELVKIANDLTVWDTEFKKATKKFGNLKAVQKGKKLLIQDLDGKTVLSVGQHTSINDIVKRLSKNKTAAISAIGGLFEVNKSYQVKGKNLILKWDMVNRKEFYRTFNDKNESKKLIEKAIRNWKSLFNNLNTFAGNNGNWVVSKKPTFRFGNGAAPSAEAILTYNGDRSKMTSSMKYTFERLWEWR